MTKEQEKLVTANMGYVVTLARQYKKEDSLHYLSNKTFLYHLDHNNRLPQNHPY